MMSMMLYTTLLLVLHCVPTNVIRSNCTGSGRVMGSTPSGHQHSKRNLPLESLVTAEQCLVLLAAALYLELVPDRDPDSRS